MLSPAAWFTNNFVRIDLQLHNYTNSMIDRGAFLLCAPLLVGVYRTEHKALFAYAALTLLVPALAGSFMSYTRMLLMVFPLFMFLGVRLRGSHDLARPRRVKMRGGSYLLHTGSYWAG